MCWNKRRLCWKIAKLFYFCHLKKLVRPETFVPYYVPNKILNCVTIWTKIIRTLFKYSHRNSTIKAAEIICHNSSAPPVRNTLLVRKRKVFLFVQQLRSPDVLLKPNSLTGGDRMRQMVVGMRKTTGSFWVHIIFFVTLHHPSIFLSYCSNQQGLFVLSTSIIPFYVKKYGLCWRVNIPSKLDTIQRI